MDLRPHPHHLLDKRHHWQHIRKPSEPYPALIASNERVLLGAQGLRGPLPPMFRPEPCGGTSAEGGRP